jgi:hypothetical protein
VVNIIAVRVKSTSEFMNTKRSRCTNRLVSAVTHLDDLGGCSEGHKTRVENSEMLAANADARMILKLMLMKMLK